jgi:hypothetical protein
MSPKSRRATPVSEDICASRGSVGPLTRNTRSVDVAHVSQHYFLIPRTPKCNVAVALSNEHKRVVAIGPEYRADMEGGATVGLAWHPLVGTSAHPGDWLDVEVVARIRPGETTFASRRIGICKRLGDDPETRGQLPVAAQRGHHRAVTHSGVTQPGAIACTSLLPSLRSGCPPTREPTLARPKQHTPARRPCCRPLRRRSDRVSGAGREGECDRQADARFPRFAGGECAAAALKRRPCLDVGRESCWPSSDGPA